MLASVSNLLSTTTAELMPTLHFQPTTTTRHTAPSPTSFSTPTPPSCVPSEGSRCDDVLEVDVTNSNVIIIGAVTSSILLLIIATVVTLLIVVMRKRKGKSEPMDNNTETTNEAYDIVTTDVMTTTNEAYDTVDTDVMTTSNVSYGIQSKENDSITAAINPAYGRVVNRNDSSMLQYDYVTVL